MHVVMVGNFPLDATPRGGVETAAFNLASALEALGVKVTVVDPRVEAAESLTLTYEGITVHRENLGGVVGRSRRARGMVREVASDVNADLVHSQGIARFLPLELPTIFTLHGIAENEVKHEGSRLRSAVKSATVVRQEVSARRAAPNVISISKFTTRYLDPERQRVWEIPNAISPLFGDVRGVPRERRVLFVGSLRIRKRVRELIAAFADGCAREGAILAIAGSGLDGSYGQGCLSLAEELGVSGSIEWLGSMTPAQLAAEMARSQVLALPSGAESAPMVIAEALAQGLPVVAADVGAVSEMVDDGRNGILVRAGDHAGLSDALVRVLNLPDYDDWSSRALQASSAYSAAEVSQKTLAAYLEVVGRPA